MQFNSSSPVRGLPIGGYPVRIRAADPTDGFRGMKNFRQVTPQGAQGFYFGRTTMNPSAPQTHRPDAVRGRVHSLFGKAVT